MAAALIPVKSLRDGKSRLAGTLTAEERHRLSLAMLDDVLDATLSAGLWPIVVISADPDVLSAATAGGARGLVEPRGRRGLNAAIEHGLDVLQRHGVEKVVVLLPDVPTVEAGDLQAIADLLAEHQVVVVPSNDGGTNALGLRLPAAIRPIYGPDSAARHSEAAWLAEAFVAVRNFDSLKADLDDPGDIEQFLRGGRGRKTRLALADTSCGTAVA
jgi:2-phospho-L-lactate/phosphoenolpyruvate guanylyltransferase